MVRNFPLSCLPRRRQLKWEVVQRGSAAFIRSALTSRTIPRRFCTHCSPRCESHIYYHASFPGGVGTMQESKAHEQRRKASALAAAARAAAAAAGAPVP